MERVKVRQVSIARVNISRLDFIDRRQINRKVVDYLKPILEATECGKGSKKDSRYDPKNYIPVLIRSLSELKRVLKASKKTYEDLNIEGRFLYFL
jgi:hypothetical protein